MLVVLTYEKEKREIVLRSVTRRATTFMWDIYFQGQELNVIPF